MLGLLGGSSGPTEDASIERAGQQSEGNEKDVVEDGPEPTDSKTDQLLRFEAAAQAVTVFTGPVTTEEPLTIQVSMADHTSESAAASDHSAVGEDGQKIADQQSAQIWNDVESAMENTGQSVHTADNAVSTASVGRDAYMGLPVETIADSDVEVPVMPTVMQAAPGREPVQQSIATGETPVPVAVHQSVAAETDLDNGEIKTVVPDSSELDTWLRTPEFVRAENPAGVQQGIQTAISDTPVKQVKEPELIIDAPNSSQAGNPGPNVGIPWTLASQTVPEPQSGALISDPRIADEAVAVSPKVDQPAFDRSGSGVEFVRHNPVWSPVQDTPTVDTARAASSLESHIPTHQPVEARMIHQIVRSASMHLFEGGAAMTLRLDPPHLGALRMSVSAQQGMVVANLQTSTEAARQVLEAGLDSLKQSLADAGIQVDSINVSVGGNADQGWEAHSGDQGGRHAGGSTGHSRFVREFAGAALASASSDVSHQATGGLNYLA